MRLRVLVLTAATALAAFTIGGPALAQSTGAGANGDQNATAGGSSVSTGNTSSSAAVNTSGGTNVGVVQGNVAEGSTGSTNQGAAAANENGGGSSGGGQSAGAADAPNAATDGVLKRLDLPAIGAATNATPASSSRSNVYVWALAGAVVLGLALVYRRLPRPSSA